MEAHTRIPPTEVVSVPTVDTAQGVVEEDMEPRGSMALEVVIAQEEEGIALVVDMAQVDIDLEDTVVERTVQVEGMTLLGIAPVQLGMHLVMYTIQAEQGMVSVLMEDGVVPVLVIMVHQQELDMVKGMVEVEGVDVVVVDGEEINR